MGFCEHGNEATDREFLDHLRKYQLLKKVHVKLVNRIPHLKYLSPLIPTLIPNLTLLFHQNTCFLTLFDVSRVSAASIVTGYRLDS
jgi:hypothetical protein